MNDAADPPAGAPRPAPASREDRLAARLRDNLRRRKAQARARDDAAEDADVALSKPAASG